MIKIRVLSQLTAGERSSIMRRAQADIDGVKDAAAKIIGDIRDGGDKALAEYAERFDFGGSPFTGLRCGRAEFDEASVNISGEVVAALRHAYRNILEFHKRQLPVPLWFTEVEASVFAGERITPIDRVALYVPGGKGFFPSVMLMLGVPAQVAGVPSVAVCTPPTRDGKVDPAVILAAQFCGITEVYKMAGAQAIAAMAIGTETIKKVDKIIGPCSIYAAAAKRLLANVVDVGVPAGPSESIIVADESADPSVVTLDLAIEAEHGSDSAATLVTHDRNLVERVSSLLPVQLERIPVKRREFIESALTRYGGVMVTDSLTESIAFVNEYAPEHLELLVKDPFETMWQIRNAGEILLGPHTPISTANFCIGLNAILPTGGFARSYSCVSVHDFMKRTGIGYLGKSGFSRLKGSTAVLANYEGFPAHALAVSDRPTD